MAAIQPEHHSEQVFTEKPRNDINHLEQIDSGRDTESQLSQGDEPMTFKKAMALIAMAFLWTGSQIPLYLYGGVPPYSKLLVSMVLCEHMIDQ